MCFSVPVFACLTPFSHSLRSGSIPKGSNLCRLTCHSLSSDRPDGGKNLRGHDDHGVLPAEQNQALAGPPRRAGIAVRRVALSLYLHPTLLKWSTGRRTAPKTAGLFWVAATLVLFQERALALPGWVGGGEACRGRQKHFYKSGSPLKTQCCPQLGRVRVFRLPFYCVCLPGMTQTRFTKWKLQLVSGTNCTRVYFSSVQPFGLWDFKIIGVFCSKIQIIDLLKKKIVPIIHIRHHQQVTLTVTSEPPSFFFPFVSCANPFRPSGRCSARAIALILSASCLPTLSWIHPTFIPSHSPEHYIDLMAMSMTRPLPFPPPKKYPDTLGFAVTQTAGSFCLCVLVFVLFFFSLLGLNWLFQIGRVVLCVCVPDREEMATCRGCCPPCCLMPPLGFQLQHPSNLDKISGVMDGWMDG